MSIYRETLGKIFKLKDIYILGRLMENRNHKIINLWICFIQAMIK